MFSGEKKKIYNSKNETGLKWKQDFVAQRERKWDISSKARPLQHSSPPYVFDFSFEKTNKHGELALHHDDLS